MHDNGACDGRLGYPLMTDVNRLQVTDSGRRGESCASETNERIFNPIGASWIALFFFWAYRPGFDKLGVFFSF